MGWDSGYSPSEQSVLLALAREAVTAAALEEDLEPLELEEFPAALKDGCGAFVTLYVGEDLRGCIGTFDDSRPLVEVVRSMGRAAATRDKRFDPIGVSELETVQISISVLTPLRPIESIHEIEVGRHGLAIQRRHRRGVLLPKVAVERGWDRLTFLSSVCVKAGLAPDTWKRFGADPEIELEVFESIDFQETV